MNSNEENWNFLYDTVNKNMTKIETVYHILYDSDARAILAKDKECKQLIELIKWIVSEDALESSIQLPKYCTRMNSPDRITAEIYIQNLQKEIRKKYNDLHKEK